MAKNSLMKINTTRLTPFLLVLLTGCAGNLPHHIGTYPKKLHDCPESPNCVSSLETDGEHFVHAISTSHQPSSSITLLKRIIEKDPGMRLIKQIDNYLYAQFTSSIWGFVDDLEFIIGDTQINVRSASRLGYSDFGANRKHIEAIRRQFK